MRQHRTERVLHLFFPVYFYILLPVMFGGCMLNTDRAVAPSTKERWFPPVEAVSTPLPSPPAEAVDPMDLAALIDEALSNNPVTQRAWFNAKTAAARRVGANSVFYPSITAAGNVQRQRIEAVGFPVGGGAAGVGDQIISVTRVSYGPMLDVSYTLFAFGALAAQADAAREALFAANFQYNRELQNAVLGVQEGYYNLHAAQAAVEAEQASLKDAKASLEAAETKNRVGLTPVQDVLKAKSNFLLEQYRLDSTLSLVEKARASLAQVLGRKDVGSVRIKAPSIQALSTQALEEMKALVDKALRDRPDLQAAYASVRGRQAAHRAAQRALFPQVVASLTGDHTKIDGFPGIEENYTGLIRLNWNIFDGFNKEARIIEESARLEASRRDAESAQLAAISDVWTRYYDLISTREQLSSAEGLLEASNAAFSAIDVGYRTGLNSILDLLSAQKDLANARVALIRSQNSYVTSIIQLEHAVGALETGKEGMPGSPIFKD